MTTTISINRLLRSCRESLSAIIRQLRPADNAEWTALVVMLCFFGVVSGMVCTAIRPTELGMMGYDTAGHLTVDDMMISSRNMLSWNMRHPLFRLLYLPVILINELLFLLGVNITWPLFLATSVVLVSLSGLFTFKTLRALGLSTVPAALLLALFCSFAHTMMLSFQVDSFVVSMFVGSAMLLLFTTKVHNRLSDNMLLLGMAGATSTNFVKFAFYQILEERDVKATAKRFLMSIPLSCILFALTLPDLVSRLVHRPRGLMYAVMGDSLSFKGSELDKWRLFVENFISEPLLFHHTTGILYSHETTLLPPYPTPWYYLPVAVIVATVVVSVIVNCRRRIIQLFICCFGFDLLMHFAVGYGMDEAQLFCGHWLFFIPVVMGLLLSRCKSVVYWLFSAAVLMTASFLCYVNISGIVHSL